MQKRKAQQKGAPVVRADVAPPPARFNAVLASVEVQDGGATIATFAIAPGALARVLQRALSVNDDEDALLRGLLVDSVLTTRRARAGGPR